MWLTYPGCTKNIVTHKLYQCYTQAVSEGYSHISCISVTRTQAAPVLLTQRLYQKVSHIQAVPVQYISCTSVTHTQAVQDYFSYVS